MNATISKKLRLKPSNHSWLTGSKFEKYLQTVVQPLVKQRHHHQLIQEALNARIGIADRLLNKWECGDRVPELYSLYCWTEALNMTVTLKPISRHKIY